MVAGKNTVRNYSWGNSDAEHELDQRRAGNYEPCGEQDCLPRRVSHGTPVNRLAQLIRSSGYFRQKARKLQKFVSFLKTEHDGSLNKMFGTATAELREQLLGVHGIGPETADSILLYAGKHPVFVVDAYTRRILTRHEVMPEESSYEEIRGLMEKSLPPSVAVYNEFHALIVNVGKRFCRPKAPHCSACPLNCFLPRQIEGAR